MNKIKEIEAASKKTESKLSGKLGIGFMDLTTGQSCCVNGKEIFPTASVFKLFILAELFRQINEERFSLNDRFKLNEKIKSAGSGVVFEMSSGTPLTLYDYALLMMIISDNTCADFLYELTGRENIRKNVLKVLGLKQTKADLSCNQLFLNYCSTTPEQSISEKTKKYLTGYFRNSPYYTCQAEENDESSPADIMKFLYYIYSGQWCSSKICGQMLDIMKKCQTNSRIPKYLPKTISVAHKTGTFDRVSNDAGIVFTNNGNYILVMFYNGNTADEEEYLQNDHGFWGDEALAHLSKQIFDIYTRQS